MQLHRCFLAILATGIASTVQAETVHVAVASNFQAPLAQLAAQFERTTGHKVTMSAASTGKLYAQIAHGAPFAVLLAADVATPVRIAAEGLGDGRTRFTYARGRLALWSAQAGYVDNAGQVLKSSTWQHIAIANPKLAPYGAAAMQTLQKLELQAAVAARTVTGENIGQTYQFAASGAAQLGFVALSQVMKNGQITSGSAWVVPADYHAAIDQDAIVLKPGMGRVEVGAFMDFLRSDSARAVMAQWGYESPKLPQNP